MKEGILSFLEKDLPILWVKTYDFDEIEEAVKEGVGKYENKKFYIYENGKTVNVDTSEEVFGLDSLYKTIDEFFPSGMRKSKTILFVKGIGEEILEDRNLEYLIEILKTKVENPKYNFIVIISSSKDLPQLLKENKYNIAVLDKEEEEVELALQKYIYLLAKENKTDLTPEKAEQIMKMLDLRIEKEIKLKGKKVENKTEIIKTNETEDGLLKKLFRGRR